MGTQFIFLVMGVVSIVLVSVSMAGQESGKLVEIDSGTASETTALTNGASFKIGDKTYRLEIEQSVKERNLEQLHSRSMPIHMQDLACRDAFNMLTHLSGVTIVCAGDLDKQAKVSINTQDDPLMDVIEQICFQIGAEATIRKGIIWITIEKSGK